MGLGGPWEGEWLPKEDGDGEKGTQRLEASSHDPLPHAHLGVSAPKCLPLPPPPGLWGQAAVECLTPPPSD